MSASCTPCFYISQREEKTLSAPFLSSFRAGVEMLSTASSAKEQVKCLFVIFAFQDVHDSHLSHHFSFHFSDHSDNSSAKHVKMSQE